MKFTLIFALMLLSYFGYSQEWILLCGNKDARYFAAKNYVSKKESIVTSWVKSVNNHPFLRDDGKYELYQTLLFSFDCENGSSALRQIVSYGENDDVVYREIISREPEYIINPPGSVGEIQLTKVCSTSNKKLASVKKK